MSNTDSALQQRWIGQRDADAFAELVNRHGGMVYGACRRVLRDDHEAQDAAQESFTELMRARSAVTTSLAGWLYTVAVRRSLDRIRQSRRRRLREESYAARAGAAIEADPDDLLAVVDEAIAAQPELYRIPIVLRFLEGRTHTDIGAQLGIAESTVRHRIERGVEEVRETLRKRGVPIGAGVLAAALEGQSAQAVPTSLAAALGRAAVSGGAPTATAGVVAAGFWGLIPKAIFALAVLTVAGGAFLAATMMSRNPVDNAEGSVRGAGQTETLSRVADTANASEVAGGSGQGRAAAASGPGGEAVHAAAVVAQDESPPQASGRVYDADSGAGLAGVKVLIWGPESGVPDSLSPFTNATGHYEIRGLAPGRYQVSPRAGRLYPGTQYGWGTALTIEAGAPVVRLDFALKRGVRVAGRVLDAAGNPQEGATVLARTKESPNPGHTETETGGSFEVYVETPSNTLFVRAYTGTMLGEVVEGLSLPSDGVEGITITLDIPRTASVSGTVVDVQGRPIRDAGLHLRVPASPFPPPREEESRTSATGTFTLAGLIPGEYHMGVTPPGVSGWSTGDVAANFGLTAGQQLRGLKIVYGGKGGLEISGIVVDTSGNPIPDARVSAWGPTRETGHTDGDGRFLISGLEEGVYHVNAEHQDYTMGAKAGVAAGTADIEIVLEGKGSLRGRVTDANSGKPLPSFRISFINGARDAFGPELLQNARSFQDLSGAFEIAEVYAGPVTVTARADGYAAAFRAVDVVEHAAAEVDFALAPGEPLTGTVLDPEGKPVRDALVFLPGISVSLSHLSQREALTRTDENGAFRIDGLPSGVNAVAAYAPPFGPALASVAGYSQPVAITLPEAGTIEGTIIDTGQGASKALVYAHYIDREDFGYLLSNVGADGEFRLTGLAPGEIEVRAEFTASGRSTQGSAIVASGQTTSLDLVFVEGTATVHGRIAVGGVAPDASTVLLEVATEAGIQGYRAHVQNDGAYSIEGVVAGSATLKAYIAPRENPTAAEVREITFDIAPGETVEQNFQF